MTVHDISSQVYFSESSLTNFLYFLEISRVSISYCDHSLLGRDIESTVSFLACI